MATRVRVGAGWAVAILAWAGFGWIGASGVGAETLPAVIVKSVPTTKRVAALTFDDGPSPKWTSDILRILHQNHVKATFFVVGKEAARFPQYLQEEIKAGMEIGSHGYRHRTLRGLSETAVEQDISQNASTLEALGARPLRLYRLPGGGSDATALRVLGRLGYTVIGWSVDPRDWRHIYSAQQMTRMVDKQIRPGGIIIFHDGPNSSQATVDAVANIIPQLKQEGYRLVTVGQLLKNAIRSGGRLPVAAQGAESAPARH